MEEKQQEKIDLKVTEESDSNDEEFYRGSLSRLPPDTKWKKTPKDEVGSLAGAFFGGVITMAVINDGTGPRLAAMFVLSIFFMLCDMDPIKKQLRTVRLTEKGYGVLVTILFIATAAIAIFLGQIFAMYKIGGHWNFLVGLVWALLLGGWEKCRITNGEEKPS